MKSNRERNNGLFQLLKLFFVMSLVVFLPQSNAISLENEDLVFVSGVLRYGTESDGWEVIEDDSHTSLNIKSVYSQNNTITLNYSFTAKKVISLIAVPDETFMSRGLSLGTSVGLNEAKIFFKQNQTIGGLVEYDKASDEWLIPNRFVSVFKNGIITVKHPSIGLSDLVSADAGSELRVFIVKTGHNYVQLSWQDHDGNVIVEPINEMRAYITRTRDSSSYTDPLTLQSNSGNIWVFGVFEK